MCNNLQELKLKCLNVKEAKGDMVKFEAEEAESVRMQRKEWRW